MLNKDVFHLLCRCALGLVFVASALLKLDSADAFGTYIYGFDLFSLEVSAVVARLLVAFEFSLGVLLFTRFHKRIVDGAVFFSLFAFSVFLLFLLSKGDDGNCYCFGEAIELSPAASLAKNLVFFVLLYFGAKAPRSEWAWAGGFSCALLLLSVALCFLLRWPDAFSSGRTVDYNEVAFRSYMKRETFGVDMDKGFRMVGFVSTSCPHCRLLTRKVDAAVSRHGWPDSSLVWVVYDPKRKFGELSASGEFRVRNAKFMDGRILTISKGVLPLFLLLRDGEVVERMSNRTFSEDRLSDFISKE